MASFGITEIESWDRFYRSNFINSLTGFKSVSLIGSINLQGKTNLGIFSSIVHIGSNPPLVGYINRPVSAASHTMANIEETGIYTINHIQSFFIEQAHQTSAKYPKEISEFEETGLHTEFKNNIIAPFVKESSIKYALSLQEIIPIKLNDTFLVIGKIISVILENDVVLQDGFIELDKAGSVCSNGGDAYYNAEFIDRYQYARPGAKTEKII